MSYEFNSSRVGMNTDTTESTKGNTIRIQLFKGWYEYRYHGINKRKYHTNSTLQRGWYEYRYYGINKRKHHRNSTLQGGWYEYRYYGINQRKHHTNIILQGLVRIQILWNQQKETPYEFNTSRVGMNTDTTQSTNGNTIRIQHIKGDGMNVDTTESRKGNSIRILL
ncbi:hypothetical protein CHS0354_021256 [Potamilus streckersoni]|uniref:Uncharacterized protein n=1 Tax=Potamilus streckersoni TaxID=2493646 RepID=A0AAE0S3X7_9BIVA|nr:hypothetical protein CHS0354_021256 [Potamilus streckersoni]